MSKEIPEYCDYHCPHAEFPPADTAGICRTMSAVWCNKLAALTNKNMPCAWRAAKDEGVDREDQEDEREVQGNEETHRNEDGAKSVSGRKRTATRKRSAAKKRK